jgi:hypothetical protein
MMIRPGRSSTHPNPQPSPFDQTASYDCDGAIPACRRDGLIVGVASRLSPVDPGRGPCGRPTRFGVLGQVRPGRKPVAVKVEIDGLGRGDGPTHTLWFE